MASVFYHTSDLGVEVNPNMSRNRSKAVPEGNGPVPHRDELESGEPTMAGLYQMLKKNFDRMEKNLDMMPSHFDRQYKQLGELTEKMKHTNQRLAGLQHKAWQPCIALEADVEPDTKTRKRTENTAAADQVKKRG